MHAAVPCELTQAHIADLHRRAERDRTAYHARRARRADHRDAATARRSPDPATRTRPAGRPHPPVRQLNTPARQATTPETMSPATAACRQGRRVLQADHLSPRCRVLIGSAFQRRIRVVQAPDDTVRLGAAAREDIRAGARGRRASPASADCGCSAMRQAVWQHAACGC
jgi:hypothetical protein